MLRAVWSDQTHSQSGVRQSLQHRVDWFTPMFISKISLNTEHHSTTTVCHCSFSQRAARGVTSGLIKVCCLATLTGDMLHHESENITLNLHLSKDCWNIMCTLLSWPPAYKVQERLLFMPTGCSGPTIIFKLHIHLLAEVVSNKCFVTLLT